MADDDITTNRGDTLPITATTKEDGVTVDATGWTIYFTVRKNIPKTLITTDTVANGAVIHKSVPGESSGIHDMTLLPAETDIDPGEYYYDFQIKKSETDISSNQKGSFTVNGDITRT